MLTTPNPRVAIFAVNGNTTYGGQATGYIPPSGKPSPNPLANFTNASYAWGQRIYPTHHIFNFTGADITNGYDILTETIPNLQRLYDLALSRGSKPWVLTPFPQTGYSPADLTKVLLWKSTVLSTFGSQAINLYDPLESGNNLNPIYDQGDGTHLNVAGQTVVANTVLAAIQP